MVMEKDPYILGSQYCRKKKPRRAFSKDVYMLFTSREVLNGNNCTRGFGSALKTEGTVFPNTDGPKLSHNIFIFFRKLSLQK